MYKKCFFSLIFFFFAEISFAIDLDAEESRIFVKGHAFQIHPEIGLDTKDWVKKHGLAIDEISARVRVLVGSATCLALARLGCVINDKIVTYDIPYFFSSKKTLLCQATQKNLTSQDLTKLINHAHGKSSAPYYYSVDKSFYTGYDFKPLTQLGKEPFKAHLAKLYQIEGLPESRKNLRLKEISDDKMNFFYHSEQSLILEIFNPEFAQKFAQKLNSHTGEMSYFFLNITGTFDSCCRCGDALRQVSHQAHNTFLDNLKSNLSTQKTIKFNQKTPFFVTYDGFKSYKDPEHSGQNPLRPKKKEDISGSYSANPLSVIENFLPRIACTFMP